MQCGWWSADWLTLIVQHSSSLSASCAIEGDDDDDDDHDEDPLGSCQDRDGFLDLYVISQDETQARLPPDYRHLSPPVMVPLPAGFQQSRSN
jgi:hypothetical protein